MRRQHSKLKWVLVLVIVILAAGMVVSFIPGLGDTNMSSLGMSSDVARVGNETVSAMEFETSYRNYLRNMQQRQQLSPEILKAFGFDRQILDALVGQKVVLAEAKRLGFGVSDDELAQRILSNPNFQAGGSFIGRDRYQELLFQNNLTMERFESVIRDDLMMSKLQSFITAGVSVSDNEAEREYRNRNEKATLSYFVLDPAKTESKVATPSEQDLKTYYETNKARYNVPEKRKFRYAFVDVVKYRKEATVSDDELRTYYGEHSDEYRLPEEVTAQHILFKTQGKTPEQIETIRKKATDVLDRAKKGEDFSKLAKEFSEDTSASRGGTLGTFGRGRMVPEFDRAAFSLGEGAISDLVTTEFGFHIIKVNSRQDGRLRTFDEIKEAIRPLLLFQKGRETAKTVAEQVALDLVSNKDLNAVAAKNGVTVKETDLVEQTAKISELGDAVEFQSKVFSMPKDEFGTAGEVENGFAVPQVIQIEPAHAASFEEARAKVTTDAKADKARELVTENTSKLRQQIEAGKTDLAALAQSVGAEIKTSEKIIRGGSLPEYGSLAERDQEIFTMPLGKAALPATFSGKTLVFAVKSRDSINPEEMKKALPELRVDMLPAKKERYFSAYIDELQKKMETDGLISRDLNLMGQISSRVQ
ncbi:MAG TPA: SurA N-terminal domain-containing protein [Terriglobia bacterium]|nr:SurA N-terminal domain-containing protein [Terriglobia bacterium]